MIISASFFLINRNVSDKIGREIQNTNFEVINILFENPAVFETIREKNITETASLQITMAHAHFTLST